MIPDGLSERTDVKDHSVNVKAQFVKGQRIGGELCHKYPRLRSLPLGRPYVSIMGSIDHSSFSRAILLFFHHFLKIHGGQMDFVSLLGGVSS